MLAEIDEKRGSTSRSVFVRESLCDYLKLPQSLSLAPDRTGKGGRARKLPPAPVSLDLNDRGDRVDEGADKRVPVIYEKRKTRKSS